MTDRTHPDSGRITGGIVEMLQARIADLEAQLASIGAGGVTGPLMGQPQAMPDLSQLTERGAVAWAGVDAQGLREGRWYMVTHDGVATLCEDRRDAEKEAKDADMAWPHSGPHRAVQLVEASTAGFTAADMATASAQGFRDGVASIAASAGATDYRGWGYAKLPEPVAYSLGLAKYAHSSNIIAANEFTPDAEHADEWESLVTMDQARDFADRTHQFRECRGDESLAASAGEPVAWRYRSGSNGNWEACTKEVHDMVLRAPQRWAGYEVQPLYTHPSPPEGMAGGWRPIETAPKNGRQLLLGYFNSAGKWRTTRGEWLSQDHIDEYAEDPDCMSPGWHETTVEDDDGKCWPIDPTHWRPLPPPPTSAEGVEHG